MTGNLKMIWKSGRDLYGFKLLPMSSVNQSIKSNIQFFFRCRIFAAIWMVYSFGSSHPFVYKDQARPQNQETEIQS